MRRSKLLIFTLLFTFICLLFSTLQVEASSPTTSDQITVKGAQIRTSGSVGIRFVGHVTDSYLETNTNVTRYGMLLAYGECDVTEIVKGATINGKEVLNAEVTKLSSDNYFYINLINVPQDMYGQKITTRSYVVNDGEIVYGDTGAERSLGQVALATKDKVSDSELVDTIYESIENNYKNYYTDSQGNIFITSSVYETVPENLEKEFIEDWNAKFGTTFTEFEYTSFQASAKAGTTALTVNSQNDCSGTNAYEFFNKDVSISTKWKWLLTYLQSISGNKVHPNKQINALLSSDGLAETDSTSGADYLHQFVHLSASLANFFNGGNCRSNTNDVLFTDPTKYSSIDVYNNTIKVTNPNLILVGNDMTLPSLSPNTAYQFDGYEASDILYNGKYTVSTSSTLLTATYSPIDFTVDFYDNDEKIDSLTTYYNIESKDITLPTYNKDGYTFNGWYTTSSFDEGTKVSTIPAGSYGSMSLYAKMEETEFAAVNVTLDPNGSSWGTDILLNYATALKEFKLTRYLSYDSGGYVGSLYSGSVPAWRYYIGINETDVKGVYQIEEIGNAGGSTKTITFDYVVIWHDSFSDADSKTVAMNIYNNKSTYVGKYIIFDGVPSEKSTDCSIKVKVLDSSELTKMISKTYIESETMPIVYKTNDTFVGWQSSLDGNVITTYPGYTTNPGDITYTAIFASEYNPTGYVDVNVEFDTNGGSFKVASPYSFMIKNFNYNGNSELTYGYDNGITTVANAQGNRMNKTWTRILIKYNADLGLWESVGVGSSSSNSQDSSGNTIESTGATYVIGTHSANTSDEANNDVNRNMIITLHGLIASGTKYYFDLGEFTETNVPSQSASWNQTVIAYSSSDLEEQNIPTVYNEPVTLPTPTKSGYTFLGWRNSYDNGLYITFPGYRINPGNITFTAEWEVEDTTYDGYIVGQFESESWVVKGDKIQLSTTYVDSSSSSTLTWKSESPAIASVSSSGTVTGVSEGLAIIKVYDSSNSNISFTFYVTVFNEDPSGILKLLVDSNNATVFTKDNLIIGIANSTPTPYYTDILGGISKLLFETYKEHTSYYLSSPANTSTLTGSGTGGVDFITFHYAADMPQSTTWSLRGGENLASTNKSQNTNGTAASWHYSVGNDGIWYCQNVEYGAWHAGTSKTMKWYATGVTTSQIGTDVYTTDVTLKSDNYFYIKGVKTSVTNTTGYSYTTLNGMGLAVKLVDDEWYIGGCYYNSSYKYISSLGGNNNSIGIESSVRKGSDLWLTWHYSAQLCAKLLNQFDLPIQRLVGHHFFSGKWCPQPMVENDLEIWYIFRDMVEKELTYRTTYSDYTLSFSSDSTYLKSNGRITSQPTYSECITYTVDYTKDGETKSVTLSSIIPGTTR